MAKKCKKMQISPKNANKTICIFWTFMVICHEVKTFMHLTRLRNYV